VWPTLKAQGANELPMLDSRTNQWLSRLQGNGPAYVSLILAALIAIELARMALSFLGGPVNQPRSRS